MSVLAASEEEKAVRAERLVAVGCGSTSATLRNTRLKSRVHGGVPCASVAPVIDLLTGQGHPNTCRHFDFELAPDPPSGLGVVLGPYKPTSNPKPKPRIAQHNSMSERFETKGRVLTYFWTA
jgi:hypothetical protein